MTRKDKSKTERPRTQNSNRKSHAVWDPAKATDLFRTRLMKHKPDFQCEALQYFIRYRKRGIEFLEHRRKKPEAAFLIRFLRALDRHLLDKDRLKLEDCMEFQLLLARADQVGHRCRRHP